jgi:glutamate-1-semialdehyde 2,1-aminomutase
VARSHDKSKALFERIKGSIAGGESSYQRLAHGEPICMAGGDGPRFWDIDGNEYLDFCLGYGPLILGHRPPKVIAAVVEQISEHGSHYTFPHELDAEVGEKMKLAVPGLDLLRFANSGTEATLAAIRLARVFTGREKILKFEGQYHGWTDLHMMNLDSTLWSAGAERAPRTLPMPGAPNAIAETVVIGSWQRREYVERLIRDHAHELAAVLCEPVMCNCGVIPTDPDWLRWLRDITSELGILLIFDEVITGFRLAPGGAQEYFDVAADIVAYGKAIGGGFPLAAFGGSAEVMAMEVSGEAYHGGTYTGSPLVLAAANVVLDEMLGDREAFFAHLWRQGTAIQDGLRAAAERHGVKVLVQGYGPMWAIYFLLDSAPADAVIDNVRTAVEHADGDRYVTFQAELFERGMYVHPGWYERWFVSRVHGDAEIAQALGMIDEAMAVVKQRHG